VDNVVTYVYAKFGDDRLWNKKALVDRKSDNNNTKKKKNNKNKNKNNVRGHWGPVTGPPLPGLKIRPIPAHLMQ